MDAQQIDTSSFDLVSLLIGVNNQYQGLPLEAYETDFVQLLNRSVELAGGQPDRVFVVSIPDYGYTPFGSRQPIRHFRGPRQLQCCMCPTHG